MALPGSLGCGGSFGGPKQENQEALHHHQVKGELDRAGARQVLRISPAPEKPEKVIQKPEKPDEICREARRLTAGPMRESSQQKTGSLRYIEPTIDGTRTVASLNLEAYAKNVKQWDHAVVGYVLGTRKDQQK
ncbi:hypothetical protein QJS04_geneDACA006632 [Acorus gramineus]|uniref:Uncharacterized protein n=1 Tax=Acorus gramineus TaxID=55184 RepID=A0AAV9A2S5_ACOGR|nr:hypothetical protein QJS04_geneDACA006632 [Acorus gramineus]